MRRRDRHLRTVQVLVRPAHANRRRRNRMVHNGRRIPWDSVLRLKTDQYKDKAWVDLEYSEGGSSRLLRLDSLVIQRSTKSFTPFPTVKGFTMPTRSSNEDETDSSGLS